MTMVMCSTLSEKVNYLDIFWLLKLTPEKGANLIRPRVRKQLMFIQHLLVSGTLWVSALLVLSWQPHFVGPVTIPVCSDDGGEVYNDSEPSPHA